MARIALDKVSLTFRVRQRGRITLKEFLVRQMFRRSVNPIIEVRALQDVCLEFHEGDTHRHPGTRRCRQEHAPEGAGGHSPPSAGQRLVEGRISSLFDIALGFEMDASGWENIAFRGYLQGETPQTVRASCRRSPILRSSGLSSTCRSGITPPV